VLGYNHMPDWTLLGFACREVEPCVGREPSSAGALRGSHIPVPSSSGHDRLSSRTFWGAGRLQGPGRPLTFGREPQRLDPDGWLARSRTHAKPIESPAARVTAPGGPYRLLSPSPNARGSVLAKLCPLDKRLLMGGTYRHQAGRRLSQPGLWELHTPPIPSPHLIQRMRDLPQRAALHGLEQLLEHVPAGHRHLLQLLEGLPGATTPAHGRSAGRAVAGIARIF